MSIKEMSLKEVTEALAEKGRKATQISDEAGPDMDFAKVKSLSGDTTAKVEGLRAIYAEIDEMTAHRKSLTELGKGRERAAEIAKEFNQPAPGFKHPGSGGANQPEVKSIGELFTKSRAYTERDAHAESTVDINLKTTMQASAGWDPEAMRINRVELYPLRKLSVFDLYPQYTTQYDTIKYMKETTHTNNAAEAAEAAVMGEAAIAMTETSDEVEKVAVWLPVTDEQLDDVPGLSQFINNRLTYMLKNRIDAQLLQGNGTTPNLWGASNLSSVQTQAKGTDPTPDAFFKAMTKIRGTTAGTGFAEPSAICIHPNDWEAIRLLRTSDSIYIFGNPSDKGPESLWGVPVVVTSAKTENTGLVGDFTGYAAVFMKNGIQFKVTDSHSTNFIYGIQAIRATIRLAAVYFRDSAFATVTGI
jgi:HK97 family phage major capsid protein